MLKKILLLLLCLSMVCVSLAACGETDLEKAQKYIDDPSHHIDTGRKAVTLDFYIPCNFDPQAGDTPSLITAMEREFNAIISPAYSTTVKFHFDQCGDGQATTYNETMAARLAAEDADVDIFMALGFGPYKDYIVNGQVADLTSYVNKNWRTLSNPKYAEEKGTDFDPTISAPLFGSAYYYTEYFENSTSEKYTDHTEQYFGIPSNYLVGTYKYYVVDRAEAEAYYTASSFPEDATSAEASAKALTAFDQLQAEIKNANPGIKDQDLKLKANKAEGTYSDIMEARADASKLVCIYSKPELTYSDIFTAVFCVSSRCEEVERAFEVLMELNTNPALHSVLQYGVKDVTYTLDQQNGLVTMIKNPTLGEKSFKDYPYKMNLTYTGNCLSIYPCTNALEVYGADSGLDYLERYLPDDTSYDCIKYASLQNMDVILPGIPTISYYKTQVKLLEAARKQMDGKVDTSENGILANKSVVYTYSVNGADKIIEMAVTDDEGTVYTFRIVLTPKDGNGGVSYSLTFSASDGTAEGEASKKQISVNPVYDMPTEYLTFSYKIGTSTIYSAVKYKAADLTQETKLISCGKEESDVVADLMVRMANLFSAWLSQNNAGITVADLGFTKF